jgi:hypothetical protein
MVVPQVDIDRIEKLLNDELFVKYQDKDHREGNPSFLRVMFCNYIFTEIHDDLSQKLGIKQAFVGLVIELKFKEWLSACDLIAAGINSPEQRERLVEDPENAANNDATPVAEKQNQDEEDRMSEGNSKVFFVL